MTPLALNADAVKVKYTKTQGEVRNPSELAFGRTFTGMYRKVL